MYMHTSGHQQKKKEKNKREPWCILVLKDGTVWNRPLLCEDYAYAAKHSCADLSLQQQNFLCTSALTSSLCLKTHPYNAKLICKTNAHSQ